MQATKHAALRFSMFLVGVGLLAPMVSVAETREAWMARRKQEAEARQQAERQRKQEQRERVGSQPSAAAARRAERDDRLADLKQRREASAAAARSGKVPADARPASPAPQPAPRIPGQPSDADMLALIQKQIDISWNNDIRAMVDRCNAGRPKGQEERQYCKGWFDMEEARTGTRGTMRYDLVTVASLTVRSCALKNGEYHCFFDIRFNGPIMSPPVDYAEVRRQGQGWQLLASSY